MKEIILFDLDGTLLDSRIDMALSVNRIRKLYQLPEIPVEVLKTYVDKDSEVLFKNCFPEFTKETIPEDLKLKYEIHYADHIVDNTNLYPQIQQVLEILSKKHFLILYANKPSRILKLLLKKLEILSLFTAILGSDYFVNKKPNPEKILKTIKELKIENQTIIVVGNTEMDIEFAKILKAKSVWCKWGYYTNFLELTPDFISKTPEDLLQIIEKNK